MGGSSSHEKARKLVNLSPVELGLLKEKFEAASHEGHLTIRDLEGLLPLWGSSVKVVFNRLKNRNGAVNANTLIEIIDLLYGLEDEQEKALSSLFGEEVAESLGAISLAICGEAEADSAPLTEAFRREMGVKWLSRSRVATLAIQALFSHLLEKKFQLLPQLNGGSTDIISRGSMMFLRGFLPVEGRDEWLLLFSSLSHGSSFSQLMQRVDGRGPVLVVVRSALRNVFGCFASHGFCSGPKYTGDTRCFLFTLEPNLIVFEATGFAQNYAYLNAQQETVPNGLGMGGYESTWPFFLSEEYGNGLSSPHVSSFEKCCLAGEERFDIDKVEVWRVGEAASPNRVQEKSVLDRDPQARAILELAGRKMHSDAHREPPQDG